MKKVIASFLALSISMCGSQAYGFDCSVESSWADLFSIRKTFNGTKEQNEPAQAAYQQSAGEKPVALVDFGIKMAETECKFPRALDSLLIAPVVEYHRNSNSDSKADLLKGGISMIYSPYFQRNSSGEGLQLPLILNYRIARDKVNNLTKGQGSLFVTIRLTGGFRKMFHSSWSADNKVHWDFRPYIGFERYNAVKTPGGTESLSFATMRSSFEWWPLPNSDGTRLQLLAEYVFRDTLADDTGTVGVARLYSAGANYYLDADEKVALGVDYSHGRNPDDDFADLERSSISLKLKFN